VALSIRAVTVGGVSVFGVFAAPLLVGLLSESFGLVVSDVHATAATALINKQRLSIAILNDLFLFIVTLLELDPHVSPQQQTPLMLNFIAQLNPSQNQLTHPSHNTSAKTDK
jgi:hypothetical protein